MKYMPRGYYYFGPLIVHAQIIEPFIIPKVFVGLSPTDMHEITFESDYARAEFVQMLEFFDDMPMRNDTGKVFEDMKDLVRLRSVEDAKDRAKEYGHCPCNYPQDEVGYGQRKSCIFTEDKPKPERKRWWPF